jgi:hypothetical protein
MSWTNVVEEYTHMHLTFMSDRLIALSGLVESRRQSRRLITTASGPGSEGNRDQTQYLDVTDSMSYECIAGIWKEDMRKQLLWRAVCIET